MKEIKKFEKPELEFVRFEATDVITTSSLLTVKTNDNYGKLATFAKKGKGLGDIDDSDISNLKLQ